MISTTGGALELDIVEKARNIEISRRGFLKSAALAVAGAGMMPTELLAAKKTEKEIKLFNVHERKLYRAEFYENDCYKISGLMTIDRALIDFRAKEIARIDVNLINLLYDINRYVGMDKHFNVLSGYRSPRTNAYLRHHSEGVAKHSYHTKGQAIDINVPGVPLRKLRDIAIALGRGGVGYYPRSNFIHVDVGPVRTWRRG